MHADPPPTDPVFQIIGGPPTDAAVAALARILLAAVETDEAEVDEGQGDGQSGED